MSMAKTIAMIKALGGNSGVANSGGNVFVVGIDVANEDICLNKTWKEIKDAFETKPIVFRVLEQSDYGVVIQNFIFLGISSNTSSSTPDYIVNLYGDAGDGLEDINFVTHSETGYPVLVLRNDEPGSYN